jgi:hypothetical protein
MRKVFRAFRQMLIDASVKRGTRNGAAEQPCLNRQGMHKAEPSSKIDLPGKIAP